MIRRGFEIELRTKGRKLEGYAATFGTEARIGRTIETIAPGAFTASLSGERDIVALAEHNPSNVLARTRSGSLRLSQDSQGLAFDLDVPDTQAGRDVLALAERNDLGGMSFGFTADDEHVDGDKRELRSVTLWEISTVAAWPAYNGTQVHARSQQPDDYLAHLDLIRREIEIARAR